VRLDITSSLRTSHDVAGYAESRLRSALAGFVGQVESVRVSVFDTGSGDEKPLRCQLKVRIVPSGMWLIHETRDADAYIAIERAVDGIKKSFMRWFARKSAPAAPVAA